MVWELTKSTAASILAAGFIIFGNYYLTDNTANLCHHFFY